MTTNSDKLKELGITTAPEKCNFCEGAGKDFAVSRVAEVVKRTLLNYRNNISILLIKVFCADKNSKALIDKMGVGGRSSQ